MYFCRRRATTLWASTASAIRVDVERESPSCRATIDVKGMQNGSEYVPGQAVFVWSEGEDWLEGVIDSVRADGCLDVRSQDDETIVYTVLHR